MFSTMDNGIEDMLNAPDETEIICSDCGRVITKKEFIEENSAVINSNIDDIKKDISKQIENDFKKIFK